MANRTDPRAKAIHGTNPQFLIPKLTRMKIHNDPYFKERCFALTAESLVDRAFEDLKYIGGCYGPIHKPTKFLCLLLKMLQIQPDDDIVLEFINQEEHKYIRALGCVYLRITCHSHADIYSTLEPILKDYRRLIFRMSDVHMVENDIYDKSPYTVLHLDELVDQLLHKDRFCDINLPRLTKRFVLEDDE